MLFHKANVDLSNHEIRINGVSYGAKYRSDHGEAFQVSRVAVSKRTVVPPQTTVHVPCKLEHPINSLFAFQPKRSSTRALLPNAVYMSGQGVCSLPVINDTGCYLTLKKDSMVGSAIEVDDLVDDKLVEDTETDAEVDLCFPDGNEAELVETFNILRTSTETAQLGNCKELPAHLTDLFETSKINLSASDQMKLKELFIEFKDVFSKGDDDLGCFTEMRFQINTSDAAPVKHKLRRTPIGFEKEEEAHLNKMLENGIIRKSTSNWASSPVLVRKKDGTVRYCLDYRDLNSKTVKDRWPLPSISSCLDTLQGNSWLSSLNLASRYWQFLIEEEDISKTAFLTKFGLFEHILYYYY